MDAVLFCEACGRGETRGRERGEGVREQYLYTGYFDETSRISIKKYNTHAHPLTIGCPHGGTMLDSPLEATLCKGGGHTVVERVSRWVRWWVR